MRKALKDYWCGQVLPRHADFWRHEYSGYIAIAIGIATGMLFTWMNPVQDRIIQLLLGILTYQAVVIGFALTATVFALTIPDEELKGRMASSDGADGQSAYSDLIFAFTWSAFVQAATVPLTLLLLLGISLSSSISWLTSTVIVATVGGAYASVLSYGLLQFMNTLLTVSQAAEAVVHSLRNK